MIKMHFALTLLLVLPLVGCVDYEDTIVFQADSSGKITINYSVDLQTMQAMEQMMAGFLQGPDGKKRLQIPVSFKKEEIEQQFKAEGIKVEKIKITDKKKDETTTRHVHVVVTFTHADKLKRIKYFKQMPIRFSKVEQKDQPAQFTYERKIGLDVRKLVGTQKREKGKPAIDPQTLDQVFVLLEPILAGKKIKSTVILPQTITKTNSKDSKDRQASWSYPVGKLLKKPATQTAEAKILTETTTTKKDVPKKDQK